MGLGNNRAPLLFVRLWPCSKSTLPLQGTLPFLQRPALLGAKVTQGSHQVGIGVAVDHDLVDMIRSNVELGERVAATRQVKFADIAGNLECAKNVIIRKINLLDVTLKALVNGKEHQVLKTRSVDGIDSTLKAFNTKGIELGADAQVEGPGSSCHQT